MKFRKGLTAPFVALALVAAAQPAMAEKGDWFMHLRAAQITPEEDPNFVDITNKVAPDLSIGYFLTDHFALDLLLTIPQKHDIFLSGDRVGDFKQLPPTLFAQWHFNPGGVWMPTRPRTSGTDNCKRPRFSGSMLLTTVPRYLP